MNVGFGFSLFGSALVAGAPQEPVSGPTVAPIIEYQGSSAWLISNGEWTGNPAPTFTRQWQQYEFGAWSDILGATSLDISWSPGSGIPLRCMVTASNTVNGSNYSVSGESNELN